MSRPTSGKGFTIIEVMIVLAIASLIILIVFLALPGLARTSRNYQRKIDAAAIAAAMINYANNNGGMLPNSVAYSTTHTNELFLGCGSNSSSNFTAEIPGFGGGQGAPNGTTCDPTDTNYETATLDYYNPSAYWGTSGQHVIWITNLSYGPISSTPISPSQNNGQTAINSDGILIVIGNGCNSSHTFISANTSRNTAAILYVLETASGNGAMVCLEAS